MDESREKGESLHRLRRQVDGISRSAVDLHVSSQQREDGDVTCVVGVDAFKRGWVAVVLDDGEFPRSNLYEQMRLLVANNPHASVIAVDIPIGLPEEGSRLADAEARRFVGPRGSSVFPTPSRAVLEMSTYEEALRLARAQGAPGISKQSFALASKIFEVDGVAANDGRIVEVHPEVSFRAMAAVPLPFAKRTWNGLQLRRRLLEENGIRLPDELPGGGIASPDDVLDAAAAAWSALRIATGIAKSLPDPPEHYRDRPEVAIWY